jgi:hypothetical protein
VRAVTVIWYVTLESEREEREGRERDTLCEGFPVWTVRTGTGLALLRSTILKKRGEGLNEEKREKE